MHERDDKTIKKKKEGETIKMNMTPQEIAKEYREAKDKGNQIKILADENLTDRKEIIKILREQGEITDKVPRSKGLRAKAEPGAAIANKKKEESGAAVGMPVSVQAALERELVIMQRDIDEQREKVEKLKEQIGDIEQYISKKENSMKEIAEFCRT